MKIQFEPRDLWIGLYWTHQPIHWDFNKGTRTTVVRFYLCIIPCFPIIWQLSKETVAKFEMP